MSRVIPTQKCGYIDIKQSSKVRPRKLKSWKRRWAVLTQMSNLSSEEYVVKLDLYDNESKWRNSSSDKLTLVLENVTSIGPVKSKTHQHAFQVVQDRPVLVISGATELESYSWILSLQQIFTPDQIEAKKDCYLVSISANEHSERWGLSGDYNLTVCSTSISLARVGGTCVISWGLNSLIKFNVKQNPVTGQMAILVIECGPNAPTGQSCFHFLSNEAQDILATIRQSICLALTLKQSTRNVQAPRQRSVSATISEKGFQKLLDNHSFSQLVRNDRSDSCSSGSTNVDSPTDVSRLSSSPGFSFIISRINAERSLTVEKEGSHASDCSPPETDRQTDEAITCETVKISSHKRSSSHPDKALKDTHDYSEIKDVSADKKPASRRITLGCQPPDYDLDKLRSVSDVFAALKAIDGHNYWRSFSTDGDNDDKSDLDSAISSMALSTVNDELPKNDALPSLVSDSADCPFLFNMRRSSSTPDLQAYWKTHENVYEELDELRASVQRLNMKQKSDTPPELPARPLFINFTENSNLNSQYPSTKQRSFVNWNGHPSNEDVKGITGSCTCKNIKGARPRFDSGGGQCTNCGGKLSAGQTKTNSSRPSTDEELTSNSLSDINAIIFKVQNIKRRRSSDSTPLPSSTLLSSLAPFTDSAATSIHHSQVEAPDMFQTNSNAQGQLINFEESSDIFELGSTISRPFTKPAAVNPSYSLMHFLDDETFDSKLMAEASPISPPSSQGLLTKDNFNYSFDPISNVLGMTPQSRTWTVPGQNIRHYDGDLDAWGLDILSNSNSESTTDTDISSTKHIESLF